MCLYILLAWVLIVIILGFCFLGVVVDHPLSLALPPRSIRFLGIQEPIPSRFVFFFVWFLLLLCVVSQSFQKDDASRDATNPTRFVHRTTTTTTTHGGESRNGGMSGLFSLDLSLSAIRYELVGVERRFRDRTDSFVYSLSLFPVPVMFDVSTLTLLSSMQAVPHFQPIEILQEHGIAANDIQKLQTAGYHTVESVRFFFHAVC